MKKIINISKNLLLALMMAFGTFLAQAQEEAEESAPALSISGSIDTYYRANLNSTNDGDNGGTLAPGTSFANLPGFSLGMANIILGMEGKKSGLLRIWFLDLEERKLYLVQGLLKISWNQLYGYWNVSDNVTLTIGVIFNTFLGYEVISPTANFNYSTSYMFSYGPFSHTGIKQI